MKSATEVVTEIQENARKSTPALRRVEAMKVGEVVRQGDLYVTRVAKKAAHGKPTKNRQLAVGETQGSRHVAVGELEVFEPREGAGPLIGPLVLAPGRWALEHPEHGHFDLPAGTFQVTYQRDYKRELAEIRRVSD